MTSPTTFVDNVYLDNKSLTFVETIPELSFLYSQKDVCFHTIVSIRRAGRERLGYAGGLQAKTYRIIKSNGQQHVMRGHRVRNRSRVETGHRRSGGQDRLATGSKLGRSTLCQRLHRLRMEPLEDRRMLALLIVDTLADTGPGSLREAITMANGSVSVPDEIGFSIAGQIDLTAQLPTITDDNH